MKKFFFSIPIIATIGFTSLSGYSQSNLFQKYDGSIEHISNRYLKPNQYSTYHLDIEGMSNFLYNLTDDINQAQIFHLPNPKGEWIPFKIWETPIFEKGLSEKYPQIRTYTAISQEDNFVSAKIDITDFGIRMAIYGESETYFLEPVDYFGGEIFQLFTKNNYQPADKTPHICNYGNPEYPSLHQAKDIITLAEGNNKRSNRVNGATKKTYRLALACTGEYAIAATGISSPSKSNVLSRMTTTMNRVNGVYERELSVTMVFISNNDLIIYTNPSTDPYIYNNNGYYLLDENQENVTAVIGNSNYDIGHIFSTGGGGIASLGSVCRTHFKAQGVTGSPEPYGDPYDIDYVCHEIGHQFGAEHTFNNCDGNENLPTAFEPGSGSTIMGYAGICGSANNLQNNSDDYFHPASLNEISSYISGLTLGGTGTCATTSSGYTNINVPSYAANYSIPTSTAYELEAPNATWSSGTNLKYSWDNFSNGQIGRSETSGSTATLAPIFRSYKVVGSSKYRSFPHVDSVHKNIYSFKGERTPQVARNLKNRLTVRGLMPDGYGSFNTHNDEIVISYINTGSAFEVIQPNTSVTWSTPTQEIKWNVAGTNSSPINTTHVDIYLSINGGATYPFVLASNVPNSGSAMIHVPSGSETTKARVKIKGRDNVFYDVSNTNFTILPSAATSIQDEYWQSLKVYPNPTHQTIQIEGLNSQKDYQINIYNLIGQLVTSSQGKGNLNIDLKDFTSGQYILIIKDIETLNTKSINITKL